MIKSCLPIVYLLFSFAATAQLAEPISAPKIDDALRQVYNHREADQRVKVFVRLKRGGTYPKETPYFKINSRLGQLVTADVSLEHLPQILQEYNISKIEYESLNSPTVDSVKFHTNAWGVHRQWGPIDRAYKGKDIIIGIVDSGVDFGHKEFRLGSDNTKTRIISLWSQWDETGTKPDSFSYGTEYTRAQIEDEINDRTDGAVPITDYDPTERGGQGHGTHVCGIAAGLRGMAPEAEIVGVSVLWETASIVDGVKYVIDKARLANKPCVINLSLGSSNNLHDGTGTGAEAYRAVANIRPQGTIICAAAGNSGNKLIHWGNFEVDGEHSTYFYGDPVKLVFAIPDSVMDDLSFSVTGFKGDYDYQENEFSGLSEFATSKWITPGDIVDDSVKQDLRYSGQSTIASNVKMLVEPLGEGSKHYLFRIEIDDKADMEVRWEPYKTDGLDLYRFNVRGKGIFNAWLLRVYSTYTGSFSRSTPDPEDIGAALPENYTYPDDNFSVIAPASYHETFSVGASVNMRSYKDTKGQTHPSAWNRKPNGSLAEFSSLGPTVDGRIQPEIVAPGQNVASAAPDYYDGWSPRVGDGKYTVSSGTSMSCPAVSGAVALYLEKFPTATIGDVRRDFLANVVEDEHTESHGALPNNHWGHGKLDIYKVMSGGIYFSTAENMGQALRIYPNPTTGQLNVSGEYDTMTLYDLQGKTLESWALQPTVNVSHLPSGVYLLKVMVDGSIQNHRIAIAH